ncbi:MAG: hypothetical protein Q4C94_00375 [Neisseria sp.]|nr:hypothetical protein [Neisseria sp.]
MVAPSICYFSLGLFFYMSKGVDYGYTLSEFIILNKKVFYGLSAVGFALAYWFKKKLNYKYSNDVDDKKHSTARFQLIADVILLSLLLLSLSSLFWMIVFNFLK